MRRFSVSFGSVILSMLRAVRSLSGVILRLQPKDLF